MGYYKTYCINKGQPGEFYGVGLYDDKTDEMLYTNGKEYKTQEGAQRALIKVVQHKRQNRDGSISNVKEHKRRGAYGFDTVMGKPYTKKQYKNYSKQFDEGNVHDIDE